MRAFFGHRRTGRLDVEGRCRADGFSLVVTHTRLLLKIECGIGDPNATGTGYSWFSMRIPALLLALLAADRLGPALSAPWWRLTSAALGMCVLYMGTRVLLRLLNTPLAGREQWRWHACEHKAAIVLESDLEPTEENIRRANPVNVRCGTIQVVTDALSNVALGLLLVHGSLWWFLVFMSCTRAWFSLMPQPRSRALARLDSSLFTQILMAPALLVALAVERLLVIRTPTDEQISATAQILQYVQQTQRWVQPPRLRQRTRPHP